MDRKEKILSVLKNTIGFSGGLNQLGFMKQKTLHKKLNQCRHKLTDGNIVSVYNMWLREQTGLKVLEHGEVVKTYCGYLQLLRIQPSKISSMWSDCTNDAVNVAASDARRGNLIKQHMERVRCDIEEYFKKSGTKNTSKTLADVASSQPYTAAAAAPKAKEKLPLNTSTRSSPQRHSIDPKVRDYPHPGNTRVSPVVDDFRPAQSSTETRCEPVVVDLTQDLWETGPHQRLAPQYVKEFDDTMPPPWNYVCHRCNRRGHYIAVCPTNSDPSFDPKPRTGYICHICGADGDHFITSCPKKDPGYWIRKKTASFLPPEDEVGLRRGPSPLSWARTGFGSPRSGQMSETATHGTGKVPSHVRKRSNDVEYLGSKAKKSKTESESNIDKTQNSRNSTWISLPRHDPSTLSEGRLTPWTDESEVQANLTYDGEIHESRSDRVAQLEAKSFMAEMTRELERTAVKGRLVIPPEPLAPYTNTQTPKLQRTKGGNRNDSEGTQDSAELCPGSSDSAAPVEIDDNNSIISGDDCISPITPRTPARIEFFVTPKSLYRFPLYHPGVLSLFHHRANLWIQRAPKPSSLDLWEVSSEEVPAGAHLDREAEKLPTTTLAPQDAGFEVPKNTEVYLREVFGEIGVNLETEAQGTLSTGAETNGEVNGARQAMEIRKGGMDSQDPEDGKFEPSLGTENGLREKAEGIPESKGVGVDETIDQDLRSAIAENVDTTGQLPCSTKLERRD